MFFSIHFFQDKLALAIVENAGEDLIRDEDLQGTPQEVLGKLAQKVSFDLSQQSYCDLIGKVLRT